MEGGGGNGGIGEVIRERVGRIGGIGEGIKENEGK